MRCAAQAAASGGAMIRALQLAAISFACFALLDAPGAAPARAQQASSAAFELVSLDGEAVIVEPPEKSGPVVLHFWATWCPSCVEELGLLDREAAPCRAARVRVVAVNVGEDVETIRRYTAQHALALESLRDPTGSVWRSLSDEGLPLNFTWLPGERRIELGPRTRAQWRTALAALGCDERAEPATASGAAAAPRSAAERAQPTPRTGP
ncbi:MAG TPA: TlpA disulfide reductase family protein [Myxococcota bacterium]|nr:TlpA disulfide reductase family protein [Myxococcota bacterium]